MKIQDGKQIFHEIAASLPQSLEKWMQDSLNWLYLFRVNYIWNHPTGRHKHWAKTPDGIKFNWKCWVYKTGQHKNWAKTPDGIKLNTKSSKFGVTFVSFSTITGSFEDGTRVNGWSGWRVWRGSVGVIHTNMW